MGDNASVLAEDRKPPAKSGSQLAQAERMLNEARSELQRQSLLVKERYQKRDRLDAEIRGVTTGADVDRILPLQRERTKMDEAIREVEAKRAELEKSVDNKVRYVETLKLSVETMRTEVDKLEERLQPSGHHDKKIQALEIDLELARNGKASEEARLAYLRRQLWVIIGQN
ncbi:MAG TPA: hypothetical protein VFV34_22770 [Blastocatellia bacterium]|nr:hypothetical protein [Blastocatellia bacterium]